MLASLDSEPLVHELMHVCFCTVINKVVSKADFSQTERLKVKEPDGWTERWLEETFFCFWVKHQVSGHCHWCDENFDSFTISKCNWMFLPPQFHLWWGRKRQSDILLKTCHTFLASLFVFMLQTIISLVWVSELLTTKAQKSQMT